MNCVCSILFIGSVSLGRYFVLSLIFKTRAKRNVGYDFIFFLFICTFFEKCELFVLYYVKLFFILYTSLGSPSFTRDEFLSG